MKKGDYAMIAGVIRLRIEHATSEIERETLAGIAQALAVEFTAANVLPVGCVNSFRESTFIAASLYGVAS